MKCNICNICDIIMKMKVVYEKAMKMKIINMKWQM